MSHWLEEKFNAFIGKKDKDNDYDRDAINKNYNNYKSKYDDFYNCLVNLFCKIQAVEVENIELRVEKTQYKDSDTKRYVFIAINKSLSPDYRRIIDFTISTEDGFLDVKYSRSKKIGDENEWKFHQKVDSIIEIEDLNDETCYRVIDWLAWKIYSPHFQYL